METLNEINYYSSEIIFYHKKIQDAEEELTKFAGTGKPREFTLIDSINAMKKKNEKHHEMLTLFTKKYLEKQRQNILSR